MSKLVKVGVMPGRISEVAVEEGATIASVIELAGLEVAGYEVKVDGSKVEDTSSAVVTSSTNLILLAKQVKGNAERVVKVGQMPGRITEIVIDSEATVADAVTLAGLTADGYEVKADGTKTELTAKVGESNLILLAKQVKGNMEKVLKVGVMPGRITEILVQSGDSIKNALSLAGLNPSGYEVKADGTKVTNLEQPIGDANLILLAKQVKGNAERVVKVGVMPGRITEVVVDDTQTIGEVLEIAGLSADGYEIKADGNKTETSAVVGTANLILLAKQVKGN